MFTKKKILTNLIITSFIFLLIANFVEAGGASKIFLENIPGLNFNGDFQTQVPTMLRSYVNWIIETSVVLGSALAVVMIIFGGVKYMTTDSFSGKSEGKEHLTNAIMGLIFLIGGYLIFTQFNPAILNVNFSTAGRVTTDLSNPNQAPDTNNDDERPYCEMHGMKTAGPKVLGSEIECNSIRDGLVHHGKAGLTQCTPDGGSWYLCEDKGDQVKVTKKCADGSVGIGPFDNFDACDYELKKRNQGDVVSSCASDGNAKSNFFCVKADSISDQEKEEIVYRERKEELEKEYTFLVKSPVASIQLFYNNYKDKYSTIEYNFLPGGKVVDIYGKK